MNNYTFQKRTVFQKKTAFILIFAWLIFQVSAQVVDIPDSNFKSALLRDSTINTNRDSEIQVEEVESIKILDVSHKGISSLTGIEQFASLTILNCNHNFLTSLDVSSNKNLIQLNCSDNVIATLHLTGLDKLSQLHCSNNRLTLLGLGSNAGLIYLRCADNQLTSLRIDENKVLRELDCSNNRLTYLNIRNGNNANFTFFNATGNPDIGCIETDNVTFARTKWKASIDKGVSFSTTCFVNIPDLKFKIALITNTQINLDWDDEIHITEAQAYRGAIKVPNRSIADLTGIEAFTSLTHLTCSSNRIAHLNVHDNTKLVELRCDNNLLTELDVTANTDLVHLSFNGNQISSINVGPLNNLKQLSCEQNRLASIDVSANSKLTELHCGVNQLTELLVNANTSATKLSFTESGFSPFKITVSSADDILDVHAYNTSNGESIDLPHRSREADLSELRSGTYLISLKSQQYGNSFKVIKR